MNLTNLSIGLTIFLLIGAFSAWQFGDIGLDQNPENTVEADWKSQVEGEEPVNATFAGGCFWCIEGVYMGEKGVEAAISGYAGGKESTATYEQVTTGETDHRESVRVKYYPSVISYDELLDMYWRSIDPTDPGGQFSDRGPHYTTAIYAHNEKQYRLAKQSKKNLSESGKFDEPIVTEIKNYTTFFRAEDYHQNYSQKNTVQYKAYERASGRKGFVEKVWDESHLG
jgi:methionine-S-sulfoxide reductase